MKLPGKPKNPTIYFKLGVGFCIVAGIAMGLFMMGNSTLNYAGSLLENTLERQVKPLADVIRLISQVNKIHRMEVEISRPTDSVVIAGAADRLIKEKDLFEAGLMRFVSDPFVDGLKNSDVLTAKWRQYKTQVTRVVETARNTKTADAVEISTDPSGQRFAVFAKQLESVSQEMFFLALKEHRHWLGQLSKRKRILFCVSLAGIGIGLFIGGFFIGSITLRVRRLRKGVVAFTRGETNQPVPVIGHDDISDLSEAFNRLQIKIHKREQALKDALDELENRVETRTRELVKSGRQLESEIAERHQAQQAYLESDEKYRRLFETATEGVYILSESLKIMDVNHAACTLHGYQLEEVLFFKFKNLLDISSRHVLDALVESLIGQKKFFGEAKGVKKNGDFFYAEVRGATYHMDNMRFFIINLRDVSDRKIAEKEKDELQKRLARSEKMEALGMLAGGVAHDLNNVLSGIVAYPDLLLPDLTDDSPVKDAVLKIKGSGIKAAAIVQDLLTLARRGVSAVEVLNLNDITKEYLESPEHRDLAASSSERFAIDQHLETRLLNVKGSRVHLYKTVMNLVANAVEAGSKNNTIEISTRNQYVDRHIKGYDTVSEGDYAVLQITDSGTGIAPEDLDKIFQPFYTEKVMGRSGTGLGMAVVWGTVQDHNGYIDIKSIPGKGTTFELYFPATRLEIRKDQKPLPMSAYMGNGEKVLVVDDIKEQREIASRLLETLGYDAASVSSGEKAVEYTRDNPVDLILLDMIMDPGIDGLDTYRQIARHTPGQKAIITSGFSGTRRVKAAQKLGAGRYVKKPYTLVTIGQAIKEALGHRKQAKK